mgnify:FL=1|jgi:hypothetical protein|tara:strand:- start:802 stop:981 length:180 start_codon:yes stop_codon:yes gene_type:complete
MAIRVKVYMDIKIDPDEYAIPSDGDVTEEIAEAFREYVHEINGMHVVSSRVTQGRNRDE